MVKATQEFQSDTSVSSELDDLSYEEKRAHIFAKQMLHGRMFIGMFQEKRYVESINTYRDVICIPKEEQDFIDDVLVVKERIESCYPKDHWIGITTAEMIGAPACFSIWSELPENTLFGKYWFKVKRVKFNINETCLRIKIVRPVTQESQADHRETSKFDSTSGYDAFTNITNEAKEKLYYFFQNITTFSNFKETIVFLSMLLATLVVSLFDLLRFISEFLLKFMNEFSNFLRSVAPIFQIFANLIERLFKTLCMLVAYLIRGQSLPSQSIRYNRVNSMYRQSQRALPPIPSRNPGVVIEEIE